MNRGSGEDGPALGTSDRRSRRKTPPPRADELGLLQRLLYSFLRGLIELVARTVFRAEVVGKEKIPRSGAFILAPGAHRSNLDTPLVGILTRRRMRYMGKESLWRNPVSAWLLTMLGGFPVERGTADRKALRACIEVVERGEPLVMFPEGTRKSGPLIEEIYDGPAYVSCRTGVPIIPVGVGGTERAMPTGSKLIKPVRLALVVGDPIDPPVVARAGHVPRRAVREMSEQLKKTLQELFDQAEELSAERRGSR
ncbi:MAG: 1-acyl-sn-glycerol-3-phosphate acyltransferase [Acidimicrobiales bacterium]|nr:MAG: 1-acyl-sn-glycerol-3-phosphate acyltransferase [Acidimicrobiales bacterium]